MGDGVAVAVLDGGDELLQQRKHGRQDGFDWHEQGDRLQVLLCLMLSMAQSSQSKLELLYEGPTST